MLDDIDIALIILLSSAGRDDRISARQTTSNMIVSNGPDVLLTPRGGAMIPVAYSVVATMENAIRISYSVRDNGNYDFQLNSRCVKIEGHEPGTGKGIVVPGYKKYSHVDIASDYVFSEGFATVSHRDPAWVNRPDEGPIESQKSLAELDISEYK